MPNANIDYVTSHQGQAHITTQNVIDLLVGISGDISGIKKFPQLYDGLANEITEALTIQVKTGAALAGGSFFILEDPFDWLLDAGAVGYSRIDILYLVMYEDPETNVQSCDFVYQVGDLYPNGTTGTAPGAPTGTDITATYPFLRMDMTDGSIVSVTDYAVSYLSNSSLVEEVNDLVEQLEQDVGGTVEQVNTNTQALNGFRFGIDDQGRYGYKKAGADTVTPFRNPTGNAGQGDVLYGKTFSNASQENVAGTMTNRGAWSDTGTGRSNVTIPAGYHNGGGYVNGIGKWDAGRTQGRADKQSEMHAVTGTVVSNDGQNITIRLFLHANSDISSAVIATLCDVPGLGTYLPVGAPLSTFVDYPIAHSYKGIGTLA